VPRGVDDIESMIVTFTAGFSGLNRKYALLLLVHEVGSSRAIVNLTDFVNLAGQFQNPFGSGRFTGVYVGKNADVPVTIQVSHGGIQSLKNT
jgi:hypothetical protein